MDQFITTQEAAKILGIAVSTLTWRTRNGHIDPVAQLNGRQYLFDRNALEKLAEQERAGAENEKA